MPQLLLVPEIRPEQMTMSTTGSVSDNGVESPVVEGSHQFDTNEAVNCSFHSLSIREDAGERGPLILLKILEEGHVKTLSDANQEMWDSMVFKERRELQTQQILPREPIPSDQLSPCFGLFALTPTQLSSLWNVFKAGIMDVIQEVTHRRDSNVNISPLSGLESKVKLQVLFRMTSILSLYLQHRASELQGNQIVLGPFYEVMDFTARSLSYPDLESEYKGLLPHISQVVKLYYRAELPHRETLGLRALTYDFQRVLDLELGLSKPQKHSRKNQKGILKGAYGLRGCLRVLLLEGAVESSQFTQKVEDVIEMCFCSPCFTSCDHGIKFLALFLSLNASLCDRLHKSFMNLLLDHLSPHAARSYGKAFLHAWLLSTHAAVTEKLEDIIQDLMNNSLHGNRLKHGGVCNVLFAFLDAIHGEGKIMNATGRCNSLIEKLYRPILWRALKGANGLVRWNGTLLFFSAFPLESISLSVLDRDQLQQKQFNLIPDLLLDDCPQVRLAALSGLGKALKRYWKVFPGEKIKTFMKIIIEDLSMDGSTVSIRVMSLQVLKMLLKEEASQEYVFACLPKPHPSLHDLNPRVQAMFLNILSWMKEETDLDWLALAPGCSLLHLLGQETSPKVLRGLAGLLQDSLYHGGDVARDIQILMPLLAKDRRALQHYFIHARHLYNPIHVFRFVCATLNILYKHVKGKMEKEEEVLKKSSEKKDRRSKKKKRLRNEDDSCNDADKENNPLQSQGEGSGSSERKEEKGKMSLDDENVVAGLLDACHVLLSEHSELAGVDAEEKEDFYGFVERAIPFLRGYYSLSDVEGPLMHLASLLPYYLMRTMATRCLNQLRELPANATQDDIWELTLPLLNWKRGDDLLQLISDWLEIGLDPSKHLSQTARAHKQGALRFRETSLPQPLLGVKILKAALSHPLQWKKIMGSNRSDLISLAQLTQSVKGLVSDHLQSFMEETSRVREDGFISSEFLALTFDLHLCLCGLLHHAEEDEFFFDGLCLFQDALHWLSTVLVTMEVEDEGTVLRTQIFEIALERIQDLIWINTVNHQVLEATTSIASHLLCYGETLKAGGIVLKLAATLLCRGWLLNQGLASDELALALTSMAFDAFITFPQGSASLIDEDKTLPDVKKCRSILMYLYGCKPKTGREAFIKILAKVILKDVRMLLQEEESGRSMSLEREAEDEKWKWPPITATLFLFVITRRKLTTPILRHLVSLPLQDSKDCEVRAQILHGWRTSHLGTGNKEFKKALEMCMIKTRHLQAESQESSNEESNSSPLTRALSILSQLWQEEMNQPQSFLEL